MNYPYLLKKISQEINLNKMMRSTPNAPDKEHNYNTLHKNYGKRGNIQQDITTESENTYS